MKLRGILELSALFLGIVNGLILLRYYLRDKPKLTVKPVHPEVYQWWFKLPDGEFEGNSTRRYGFLTYVGIANRGLRKVSVTSWRLCIKTVGFKREKLKPMSIPEPQVEIRDVGVKLLPVLGVKGLYFEGETLVEPGMSISGMAYYIAEFYGDEVWNPRIRNGKITGEFVIKDVFGKKAKCKIGFSEKPLEEITSMIEDIDKIG